MVVLIIELFFPGIIEIEMMKERFSKLLLGEDMSGCGNGVCTALAISNAITNLCGMQSCLLFLVLATLIAMHFCGKIIALYFLLMIVAHFLLNIVATMFGQLWRLEPLQLEKKAMWRREMDWLVCVSDYIVELIPTWQTFPDGSKLEVQSHSILKC